MRDHELVTLDLDVNLINFNPETFGYRMLLEGLKANPNLLAQLATEIGETAVLLHEQEETQITWEQIGLESVDALLARDLEGFKATKLGHVPGVPSSVFPK